MSASSAKHHSTADHFTTRSTTNHQETIVSTRILPELPAHQRATPRRGRRAVAHLWDGRAWPCDGHYAGAPVFRYGWAPSGLATIRQLRSNGLRPGGQDVAAWLVWGPANRHRWAYLYRIDLARPKRPLTPSLRAGIDRANTARRICPTCGRDAGYRIPRSLGQCWPCSDPHAATEMEAAA